MLVQALALAPALWESWVLPAGSFDAACDDVGVHLVAFEQVADAVVPEQAQEQAADVDARRAGPCAGVGDKSVVCRPPVPRRPGFVALLG